ncbi:MAG: sugar transferase [Acidobacteriaceae bacterium]
MLRRIDPVLLAAQFVLDLLLTLFAVKLAEQARLHIVTHLEQREQFIAIHPAVYLLVLAVWVTLFLVLGVADVERRSTVISDLGTLWLAVTLSMLVLASLFYLLWPSPQQAPSRLFYTYFYGIDILLLTTVHLATFQILGVLRRKGRHVRRVVLVGGGVLGRHVFVRLRGRDASGLRIVGYVAEAYEPSVPGLPLLGVRNELLQVVAEHQVDEVVVALPAEAHLDALKITSALQDTEVNVRILPDVFEMVAMKARVEDFFGLPLISIREPSINPVQARVKRVFDLAISLTLLVSTGPLMAILALLIRLDSAGPILIHQRRIGAGGVPFSMHKFRTMRWEPGAIDSAFLKRPDDPRVTRVGRFLRRASLDELPQLWNVVRGEMSLVGPRPELPAVVELYEPWQRKRFLVPPGMTGWWQVSGRSDNSMHLNTEIDLFYVQNYSILLDVQILLRTLGAVIKGRGAF